MRQPPNTGGFSLSSANRVASSSRSTFKSVPLPELFPTALSYRRIPTSRRFTGSPSKTGRREANPALPFSVHLPMDTSFLETKFDRIGARLKVAGWLARSARWARPVTLNIRADGDGEFFEITTLTEAEIAVLDVQPRDRHLLLLVREGKEKSKFLCGHDERHWFVAGIPESAPVGTVRQAKEALKPPDVQAAQARQGLRSKARDRRKNSAYVRQGEWFFLPVADMTV